MTNAPSFYNHFETKEQLFDAAVEAAMDTYGQLLDELTADIEDPAEVFAVSFRLTGRLGRREPELSRVLLRNVLRLLSADNGLAPRVRRDIAAAVDRQQRVAAPKTRQRKLGGGLMPQHFAMPASTVRHAHRTRRFRRWRSDTTLELTLVTGRIECP